MSKSTTYRDAGVDIDEGNRLVDLIKPLVKATFRPEVNTDIGGFGALFKLDLTRYKKPVLVSSTDGVGTKLKVAFFANKHDTVGIDLVAMSVNDLVVQGAEPLFFLDYFACGKLAAEHAAQVVGGIAEGCRQAGCSLIGGETAEMPGFYSPGEYDLAGFAVGIVDEDKVINGRNVTPGDAVLGLKSNGLHSNGYSLVRRVIFDQLGLDVDSDLPGTGLTVGAELLRPTRIYVKALLKMIEAGRIHALAHITGGGFFDNIPRVLPEGCMAVIKKDAVPVQPVFKFLQEAGKIAEREMFRTFNMGIGMIVIAPPDDIPALRAAAAAEGEDLVELGHIAETRQDPHVIIE
jgi:phosphoribosylformylglycinamidine cyclo-ligase